MSQIDRALDRLLRSAARVRPDLRENPPFDFETRVLAGLRHPHHGDLLSVVRLIRHGLVWASVLMMIALAMNFYPPQPATSAELDVTAPAWTIIAREP